MTQLQHGRDGFIALLQSAAATVPVSQRERSGRGSWRLTASLIAVRAGDGGQGEPGLAGTSPSGG